MYSVLLRVTLMTCLGLSRCASLATSRQNVQKPLGESNVPDEEDVLAALKKAEVIPDVLSTFDVQFFITPIYPEAKKRVELGNILSPDDVDLAPDLELSSFPDISSTDKDTVYTLVLSDPDALSHDNPVKSQMCHWIVTNITLPVISASHSHPGTLLSLVAEDTSGIVQLKKYFPPSPPLKTGYHRYVFAFLKSTSKNSPIPKKPKKRAHWGYRKIGAGIKEWSAENELEVVGANFFYAQNEKQ